MTGQRGLEYKGYRGVVEFDDAAGVFHGEVMGTRDVITFQGRSVDDLDQAFRESIDDYLEFCATRGEEPDRPFSGNFSVRISPEAHRAIYMAAKDQGLSLNEWVATTLTRAAETPWRVTKTEEEQGPRVARKG